MNEQQTVTINGVSYDARTGMRLENTTVKPQHHDVSAHSVHTVAQHTKTLSRRHVKTPARRQSMDLVQPRVHHAKSSMVTRFAPAPKPAPSPRQLVSDIGPIKHPTVQKVEAKQALHNTTSHLSQVAAQPRSAKEIKKHAISDALERSNSSKKSQKKPKVPFTSRHARFVSIASASLAIILLAGYFTYINLPNLSVKVAAVQAGIDATYPSYQPSGYSLHGPVAYSSNQVSMKFAANAGTQSFEVAQVKSSWDSSALLENYVRSASNDQYDAHADGGLTIYTYGTNAAWVNGGILHTIKGDAPLTTDQVLRIATSM